MKVDKSKWVSCTLDSVCDIQFGTRIVKKQTEAGQYYVYGGGGATLPQRVIIEKALLQYLVLLFLRNVQDLLKVNSFSMIVD